jgi:hypothetical protein
MAAYLIFDRFLLAASIILLPWFLDGAAKLLGNLVGVHAFAVSGEIGEDAVEKDGLATLRTSSVVTGNRPLMTA